MLAKGVENPEKRGKGDQRGGKLGESGAKLWRTSHWRIILQNDALWWSALWNCHWDPARGPFPPARPGRELGGSCSAQSGVRHKDDAHKSKALDSGAYSLDTGGATPLPPISVSVRFPPFFILSPRFSTDKQTTIFIEATTLPIWPP